MNVDMNQPSSDRKPSPRLSGAVAWLLLLCLWHGATPQNLGYVSAADSNPTLLVASNLPPHPRLLLNADGIKQLKDKIATQAWAKRSWADLKSRADEVVLQPVVLPPRGGNWSHNYVCPTHGARLSRGKQVAQWQWEHICPVGDHILRGDPAKAALDFDGNAISGAHGNLAEQSLNHGLVFQVTGDQRHARRAREILIAYAGRYASYPLHDNQGNPGKGGRVASQSLTEASWLIDMTQGADLVWATFSQTEQTAITEKLLRPALNQVLLPRRLGIHNIQCRQNSAIGLVGLLIGDSKLVTTAIDDPEVGFHQQMERGVLADGLWLEGSSGYHFFTIAGLWPLTEAARNCGINLYGPKLKAMFDGPLALAMPNLVLPNFNDSGTVALQNQSDIYELALARYGDASYSRLVQGTERRGRMALLFGLAQFPSPDHSIPDQSRNLTASGYAVLEKGTGTEATWLCVKYGPHGGGHGHPDKNTFILYSRGQILVTDAGTHAYGSALHRDWDKTTLAHNTLIVDETSQTPAAGKCLAFGTDHDVAYSITDAGPIYADVNFTRTAALLTPDLMVFVDQVKADRTRLLDVACHAIGAWTTNQPSGEPWASPQAPGYSRLTRTISRTASNGQLSFQTETETGRRTAMIVAVNGPTELITGHGLLKTTEDLVPVLLQRRRATNTAFIWALSLDGSAVTLRPREATDQTGKPVPAADAIAVEVTGGERKWLLAVNPQQREIRVAAPGASELATTAAFTAR
jgi:hypothetical protein